MNRLSILIIDDDIEFPRLLGLMLGDKDFEVTTVHDGAEGILRCQYELPDLVIVDGSMPGGLSGWEVTRQLRDLPNGGALPIMMLSGYADQEAKHRAIEAGVYLYLTKPIFKDTLVRSINHLLGIFEFGELSLTH